MVAVAEERVVPRAEIARVAAEIAGGAPVLLGDGAATPSARSVARLALAGDRIDELRAGTPVYMRGAAAEVAFPAGNPGGPFGEKKQSGRKRSRIARTISGIRAARLVLSSVPCWST